MNEFRDVSDAPVRVGTRGLCLWMADDHPELLSLLVDLLGKTSQINCARLFNSAEALLDALTVEAPPEAILMDVNMGGMTGVEAITPVKRLASSTRVFIMTTFYDSYLVTAAQQAGAAGFFLKSGDWDEVGKRLLNPSADWEAPAPVTLEANGQREEVVNAEEPRGHLAAASGYASRRKAQGSAVGRLAQASAPLIARALALVGRAFLGQPLQR